MLHSEVGLSQPRRDKRKTQTPFHAMVYERFSTMSFAAKGKRRQHAICEPEFSTARLSFNTKRKNALFAKGTIEFLDPVEDS
jgi:hypothetical protein